MAKRLKKMAEGLTPSAKLLKDDDGSPFVEWVSVLSTRTGDIVLREGVLHYNETMELPKSVALDLVEQYPDQIRILQ